MRHGVVLRSCEKKGEDQSHRTQYSFVVFFSNLHVLLEYCSHAGSNQLYFMVTCSL